MKKNFLLIVLLLVLTGCSHVNYDISVNQDFSIDENVYILTNKSFFDSNWLSKEMIIANMIIDEQDMIEKNGYVYDSYSDGDLEGAVFTKKYNNFELYAENKGLTSVAFNSIKIEENGNIIKLEAFANGEILFDDLSEISDTYIQVEGINLNNLNINFTLPFKVLNSNADKCTISKKNTICQWNFKTGDKLNDIYIEFDKNSYVNELHILILIGIVILILLFVIFIIIRSRILVRNKI